MQELKERKREEYKNIAVFPCKLRILPDCVFNARDPIVVGVVVEGGLVKPGTPIIVPSKNVCNTIHLFSCIQFALFCSVWSWVSLQVLKQITNKSMSLTKAKKLQLKLSQYLVMLLSCTDAILIIQTYLSARYIDRVLYVKSLHFIKCFSLSWNRSVESPLMLSRIISVKIYRNPTGS